MGQDRAGLGAVPVAHQEQVGGQSGTVEGPRLKMLLRQLSYAIKTQLKAPKAQYWGYFLPFPLSLWLKNQVLKGLLLLLLPSTGERGNIMN